MGSFGPFCSACSSFFFLDRSQCSVEPLILYCSVVELDWKIHSGLGSQAIFAGGDSYKN